MKVETEGPPFDLHTFRGPLADLYRWLRELGLVEAKRRPQTARDSADLFRQIAENVGEVFFVVDHHDSKLLYVNRAYEKIWGRTRESLYEDPNSWIDAIVPEDRERVKAALEKQLRPGEFREEFRVTQPDQSVRWVQARVFQIRNSQGKIYRRVGIAEDITERKLAEEALKNSEERYRSIFESAINMIHVVDDQHRIVDVNERELRELGYSRRELIGKPLLEIVHSEFRGVTAAGVPNVRSGETIESYETALLTKDGNKISVLANVVPQMVEGKFRGAQAILQDITQHKRVEQEMLDSRERLRSLTKRLQAVREEERGMMAREIHDQVGQALTSLKIDLSWLVDKLPKNQKAARGRASSMISVVDTTLESVHDLSARLRPAMLDDLGLDAAIEWQVQEFTSRTGCKCKLDLRTGDLGLSHDRDTTVFRILQEALTNVARHAEASRVEITLQTPPGQLVLEVRDDGKGIPREKLASGRSLGLISMHERAATLGGEVDFYCPAEGGTVLSLRLPIAAARS